MGGAATILSGNKLNPLIFNTSASDIVFTFPPTSGLSNSILTDIKNSRFSIFRKQQEILLRRSGGILYRIENGEGGNSKSSSQINPMFKVNIDTRVIEFIHRDSDSCRYCSSIEFSDESIYIETFGLVYSRIKNQIKLNGSSYRAPKVGGPNIGSENIFSGNSVLFLNASEPTNLSDVKIRKIIKDRFIPIYSEIEQAGESLLVRFEEDLSDASLVSSNYEQVYKENMGRYIEVDIDSDNILFSKKNIIRIYGDIVGGSEYEEFKIDGNGRLYSNKIFKSISKIDGSLFIADEDYELCNKNIRKK